MKETRDTRVGVLFLGRKRPGFDQGWGKEMERRVLAFFENSPYDYTALGKAVDTHSLLRALDECRDVGCEVLVAVQTTISDGRLAPELAQRWPLPIVLWATPERHGGPREISNSLVGTHLFASILRRFGHPFEILYGSPQEEELLGELDEAIRCTRTTARLRTAKIGTIGGQAPGYLAMRGDQFALGYSMGVQVRHFSIHELLQVAESISERRIEEDVREVLSLGLPFDEDVTTSELPVNSRIYLALTQISTEEGLDALALREWPELPEIIGQWVYLALVRLNMNGLPTAMEGDVEGALLSLVGSWLGIGTGYISDWLEHDDSTVTTWHMGNAPLEMCYPVGDSRGPRLARHFNIPKPVVVNATLEPGRPVTLCRIWSMDGGYRMFARNGVTVPPDRDLLGTNGRVELEDTSVQGFFHKLCHEGMPHHVTVFPGHHQNLFTRFARQVGAKWIY
ncbi:L-fucose/L-arabinose isomerase family protein [Rubrobacter calidifluminis]|uniref:L-fucose/L-arabinose isomerase family protein n=1 Tax=Rubrobacter calidifluminis TaxID=1392640 RepID=UPI002362D0B7|nr:L-fucose/L-arabinose isomerase family protein [Rubrobacter calidifluminis]